MVRVSDGSRIRVGVAVIITFGAQALSVRGGSQWLMVDTEGGRTTNQNAP